MSEDSEADRLLREIITDREIIIPMNLASTPSASRTLFDRIRAYFARKDEDPDVALVRRSFDCTKGSNSDQALDRIAARLKSKC